MKKQLYFSLLISLLTLTYVSCKKIERKDCGDPARLYYELAQQCYTALPFNSTIKDPALIVINSKDELEASLIIIDTIDLVCKEAAEFWKTDFSKYTLIIGQKNVSGMVPSMVIQQVVKDCSKNSITYSATIKNGGYQALGRYVFAVRIAKQGSDVKFAADITLIN
ncbi:MAG: hypothetical protein EOO89_13120 [Pedobacter sp.]|nr:MAG: hypothetical protein EOO89_13120 [Pedobacter sp.]